MSKSLRVLPCFDSSVRSHLIAVIRPTLEIDLLSIASASTLVCRSLADDPDAIVIATEDFPAIAWRNDGDLIHMLASTPAVLLSGRIHPLLRKRAAAFHIRSVLPLDVTSDQLLTAIRATVAGLSVSLEPFDKPEDFYAGSKAADAIESGASFAEHLTPRETGVLRLMALGLGNKEIALRLDISEHTAKFHVSSILGKFGAASRTEAVTIGMTRGLVAL